MNIGIIGCGLIGQKRAAALGQHDLLACTDLNEEKAKDLAKQFPNCEVKTNSDALIKDDKINIVIIATLHNALAKLTHDAIKAGKHVLVEKPGARNSQELQPLLTEAKKQRVNVHVGFNHRYHRALRKARELVDNNALGELMFIRGRYGHGGRIGYDKEWRANPELSGGGELIDQGVHLIDLARWFLGDFEEIDGSTQTYFWDMPVEDNAFLTLKTANKKTAFLHASCTEWKNMFSMEIYGKIGKLAIDGLGGSYGTEKITYYKMLPQMGPPETTVWEYPTPDDSWNVEFAKFTDNILNANKPNPGLEDAIAVLNVVKQIYERNKH